MNTNDGKFFHKCYKIWRSLENISFFTVNIP